MTTLLELVESDTSLKLYSRRNGGEYRGACPVCGGDAQSDRFIVWPYEERPSFWCRRCLISGDSIAYLRTVRGLSFQDACWVVGREFSPLDRRRAARERAAKERTMQQYHNWCRAIERVALRWWHHLWTDIETAEIACRAITRRPDLYTESEVTFWQQRLTMLYTRRDAAAHAMAEQQVIRPEEQERQQWEQWNALRKEHANAIHGRRMEGIETTAGLTKRRPRAA